MFKRKPAPKFQNGQFVIIGTALGVELEHRGEPGIVTSSRYTGGGYYYTVHFSTNKYDYRGYYEQWLIDGTRRVR